MGSKITIFSVVDVIEALSGGTLQNGNLCMMDNSSYYSINQGTPNLCTFCYPGQEISWTVLAVDLQTPVAIRSITFLPISGGEIDESSIKRINTESDKLHLNVWSGIVPCSMVPGVEYNYRFELQMYDGTNSIMYVDTPSLKCIS